MPRRALAAPAWVLLALFIVYASAGTWAADGPRVWAPTRLSWPDVAQNLLTYITFGIVGGLTLGPGRRSTFRLAIAVAMMALAFSLFVEGIQLYTVDRTASITDVLAAVVGAAIGAVAAAPFARVADRAMAAVRPSGVFDARDTVVLMALAAALAIAAWWPFDPTLDVSTLAERVRVVRRDPWQFGGVAMVVQALLYSWLSLAIAACAWRLRTVEAMIAGVAAAIVIAVILDVGQLAMGAVPIGLAGLGAQVAGAVAGGALFAMARVPK